LGTSADYILFGEKTDSDLSVIYGMLSGLGPQYIPFVEQMLSAYVRPLPLRNLKISHDKKCRGCYFSIAFFPIPVYTANKH
jgi:hypothetical protein